MGFFSLHTENPWFSLQGNDSIPCPVVNVFQGRRLPFTGAVCSFGQILAHWAPFTLSLAAACISEAKKRRVAVAAAALPQLVPLLPRRCYRRPRRR